MPPKPQQKVNKKTDTKQKEKVIEDKTFGLKNKKGAKQQKFIQKVQHQVKNPGQSAAKLAADKHELEKKKKEKDELADLNQILKPVTQMPKIDNSVDPKSILCVFFKQGMCEKGGKCKFSHDLSIERKSEKINLYVDSRESGETMEDWDEEKLAEVAETKHGESDKAKPKTGIVCKYFLDAVEEAKYGWFWECPNSEKCIYRHALPSGYVLRKDKKKLDEVAKGDEISLEDLIKKERAALGAELTKITYDTFLAWKRRKVQEKRAKLSKEATKKLNEFKAGRQTGLSGRDLFTFKTDWADDEEADETSYHVQEDEENNGEAGAAQMEAKEIDFRSFCIGDDGELDEFSDQPGSSNGLPPTMEINEDLFDPDDIPDDFDDDDGLGNESDDENKSDESVEEMTEKCRIIDDDDSPEK